MELKLKEGVDLSLLTTQHEIELMALQLLDDTDYHTKSEIKIEVMIALVAYCVEDNLFEKIGLQTGQELLDTIINIIEPMYYKIKAQHDNFDTIVNMMVEDVSIYLEREFNFNNSIMGFLNTLLEIYKKLEPNQQSDMINLVTNTVGRFQAAKTEEQAAETETIISEKMNDLIQKYKKAAK